MKSRKISLGLVAVSCAGLLPTQGQTQYWNTDSVPASWTGPNWGGSASGPFTSSWTSNSPVAFTANSNVTFASTAIGNVTVDAGVTVNVTAGGTLSSSNSVRTIDVGAGGTLNWSSQTVSNNSTTGFIKNGAGTWNLNAMTASTGFTGGFTLNAGTVIVSGDRAFGTGSLTINGGTIQSSGTRSFGATALTVGGDFTLTGTGNSTWSATLNLGSSTRTITNNAGGSGITRSFGGVISGDSGSGITFAGAGNATTILGGANTYAGGTTLNSGTLQLAAGGTFGSTTGSLAVNGGTLDLNGTSQGVGNLSGTGGKIANNSTGTTVTLTIGHGDGTGGSYAGVIADHASGTGTIALTKVGTGTITLSGTNSYSAGTNINGGVLGVASSQALGISGPIAFGGGTLQHSSGNTTDYSARIAGSASAIAVDTNGQSVTYASALSSSNTGGLSKSGLGTLNLTGSNAYTGGTSVSGGTLAVTGSGALGSTAGTVSVTSGGELALGSGATIANNVVVGTGGTVTGSGTAALGGTISGNGELGGTLTVASGGSIAPGNSPGTLAVNNGSLTFASGSTYAWELNSLTTVGAGSNYDVIALTGTSSLRTNAVFLVPSFTGTAAAPNLGATFWNSARSWTVVAGNSTSTISGTFFVTNSAWSGNGSFSTGIFGDDLLLNWTPTAIPEPSTYAAIFGVVALATAAWRRQRQKAATR